MFLLQRSPFYNVKCENLYFVKISPRLAKALQWKCLRVLMFTFQLAVQFHSSLSPWSHIYKKIVNMKRLHVFLYTLEENQTTDILVVNIH